MAFACFVQFPLSLLALPLMPQTHRKQINVDFNGGKFQGTTCKNDFFARAIKGELTPEEKVIVGFSQWPIF